MSKIGYAIDHEILTPGLYLGRRDENITAFDLRFKTPNTHDLLSNAEIHSLEHLLCKILRSLAQKDAVVYFGPFGCQTGFYFLFDSNLLSDGEAIDLLRQAFALGAAYEDDIPWKSPRDCGNYYNLDLELAKKCCAFYLEVIRSWTVDMLPYPQRP